MNMKASLKSHDPIKAQMFYRLAIQSLQQAKVPLLIEGAYSLGYYSGTQRDTKDMDFFILKQDLEKALVVMQAIECKTEVTDDSWLAKAYQDDDFIDFIFN